MIVTAYSCKDNSFRELSIHGFSLRVSEDGTRVELQTRHGWRVLKHIPGQHQKGYLRVRLSRRKTVSVHKLVALAWHGQPPTPEHVMVEHLDGNRQNNRASNVRWATFSDNLNSALRLREREPKYPMKLNESIVYTIRKARQRSEIASLADEHGTGDQTVRDVFDGHTWKRVRIDQGRIDGTF